MKVEISENLEWLLFCLFRQLWLLEFDSCSGNGSAGSRRVACSAQVINVVKAMKIHQS